MHESAYDTHTNSVWCVMVDGWDESTLYVPFHDSHCGFVGSVDGDAIESGDSNDNVGDGGMSDGEDAIAVRCHQIEPCLMSDALDTGSQIHLPQVIHPLILHRHT